MSANPSILEGGQARYFGMTQYLRTMTGDGACLWVPEDERQLGRKSITQNGAYPARDDDVYGWSEVTVNVSQADSVTGKDPETGKEETVSRDPITGDLKTDPVPVRIEVIVPPDNPYAHLFNGAYADGQGIGKSGMVVKAYDEDGNVLLTVPNAECTLNPNHADMSRTSGIGASEYEEFGTGPWPQPVNYAQSSLSVTTNPGNDTWTFSFSGGYIALLMIGDSRNDTLFCSASPGVATVEWQQWSKTPQHLDVPVEDSYTYNGKTVYYNGSGYGGYDFYPDSGMNERVSGSDLDRAKAAWTILYGTMVVAPNTQTITCSWPRTGDRVVLEDTFDILVVPNGQNMGD